VPRVARIERRGVRSARALARVGACTSSPGGGGVNSGGASGGSPSGGRILAAGVFGGGRAARGGDDGATRLVSRLGVASEDDGNGSGGDSPLPPLFNGGRGEPSGVSLAIGVALILLALIAGFATPHLRGRVRSS
jgi:hypothetical protein